MASVLWRSYSDSCTILCSCVRLCLWIKKSGLFFSLQDPDFSSQIYCSSQVTCSHYYQFKYHTWNRFVFVFALENQTLPACSLLFSILCYVLPTEGGGGASTLPRLRVSTISSTNLPNRASTMNPQAFKKPAGSNFSRRSADRMSWSGSRAHSLQVRPFCPIIDGSLTSGV